MFIDTMMTHIFNNKRATLKAMGILISHSSKGMNRKTQWQSNMCTVELLYKLFVPHDAFLSLL